MEKIILKIYDFFSCRRRYLAFLIPVLLMGAFWLTSRRIVLNDDISAFLPYGNSHSSRSSQFLYRNLRSQDKVIALITLKSEAEDRYLDIERLSLAADEFSYRLEESPIPGIKDINSRIDASQALEAASFIAENMPYFLDSADYAAMEAKMASEGGISAAIDESKASLISSNGLLHRVVASDPIRFSSGVMKDFSDLGQRSGYNVIGEYLFTSDSSAVMMNFSSEYGGSETGNNARMLSGLYAVRDSVESIYPDVEIRFTGSPVIAVMNAERMRTDAATCALISIFLIVAILVWYFRRLRPILLICLPVVFGILAGLAFMGVFRPDISSIALAACSVIFGIAVDYSLLYSTRLGFVKDSRAALSDIASPMIIGNITTVGAFLSLLVMSASGMRDFGLFAAVSLTGAILFVILFLPHWAGNKGYKAREGGWMGKWASFRPENSRFVFWGLVAITVVLFFFSRKVTFSGDFTKINYMAKEQEDLLSELSAFSGTQGSVAVYLVSEGPTIDDALEGAEKNSHFVNQALAEGDILETRGIGQFLPSSAMQRKRLGMWRDFAQKNGSAILDELDKAGAAAGFSGDAFDAFKNLFSCEFEVKDEGFFSPVASMLSPFILQDSISGSMVMEILYTPEDKTKLLYEKFEGCQERAEGGFLFDSYSMTDKMIDVLQEDFNKVLFICSVLVFLFLWIAFRRLELALAAFLPMVISWIWITGIMGIFGISFNIVNIVLATFIFGLGDDYTIFMVEGLQYEHTFRKPLLSSYKTGVTLSALTMLFGVGSLIMAVHPALHSLGVVAVIGMFCVVVLAFVMPPSIFRFLVNKSLGKTGEERIFPVRMTDIAVTLYCAAVFTAVCLWYKLRLSVSPVKDSAKLRRIICSRMRFFAANMPRVSFSLVIGEREYYGRKAFEAAENLFLASGNNPYIIISNHQSHLDLLYLLALSPDIVVLTNRWAYNTPVYGSFIRKAGYICTDDGVADNQDFLRKVKDSRCSLLIFPEGTRSKDLNVLKFKSGAFAVADSVQLDVLPLVLFGTGEILPKKEHILRRGKVVIEVKDIVSCESLSGLGARPLKQAQAIRHQYVEWCRILEERAYSEEKFRVRREKDYNLYKSGNEMV